MGIRMHKRGIVVKDDGILTADDIAPALNVRTYREWMRRVRVESKLARLIMDGRPINENVQGKPVIALIEYGRWLAYCECGGLENITPNDPIFFCFSCCNEDNGFHVRPVKFPSAAKEIEAVVMERGVDHRHWLPHESVTDLISQNVELGKRGLLRKAGR